METSNRAIVKAVLAISAVIGFFIVVMHQLSQLARSTFG
jgi:hypothetical protein